MGVQLRVTLPSAPRFSFSTGRPTAAPMARTAAPARTHSSISTARSAAHRSSISRAP